MKLGKCKHCGENIILLQTEEIIEAEWRHMVVDSNDYTSEITIRTRTHCTTAKAEPEDG